MVEGRRPNAGPEVPSHVRRLTAEDLGLPLAGHVEGRPCLARGDASAAGSGRGQRRIGSGQEETGSLGAGGRRCRSTRRGPARIPGIRRAWLEPADWTTGRATSAQSSRPARFRRGRLTSSGPTSTTGRHRHAAPCPLPAGGGAGDRLMVPVGPGRVARLRGLAWVPRRLAAPRGKRPMRQLPQLRPRRPDRPAPTGAERGPRGPSGWRRRWCRTSTWTSERNSEISLYLSSDVSVCQG